MTRKLITISLCLLLLVGAVQISRRNTERRKLARDQALVQAVANGDLEQVGRLLQEGADVRTRTDIGESLLITADNANSPDVLTALVQRGLSLSERDRAGYLILHRAARRGETPMLEAVVRLGLPVNEPDARGRSALTHALRAARFEAAQFLLSQGASVKPDPNGEAPLVAFLASDGNPRSIPGKITLLPRGARRLPPGKPITPATAKSRSVAASDYLPPDSLQPYRNCRFRPGVEDEEWIACVRALLEHGADPNAQDASGHSAIEIALARGATKTARLLVDKVGAWRDDQGRTALRIAAEQGNFEQMAEFYRIAGRPSEEAGLELLLASWLGDLKRVQSLLAAGADPNRSGIRGRSALYGATRRRDLRIVKLLLAHGAIPSRADFGRNTPLHAAAGQGWVDGARALLAAGAPVDALTTDGWTPLHLAAGYRNPQLLQSTGNHSLQAPASLLDMVQLLLDHGADPNAVDERGWSPLRKTMLLSVEPDIEVVRLLLKRGARDRHNANDDPLLFIAVQLHDTAAAEALLAYGADINELSPHDGATPLSRATINGNLPMVRFLRERHAQLSTLRKAAPQRVGSKPVAPVGSRR